MIPYCLALLIPGALAGPVFQRQNTTSPVTVPPKVTIGGPDHPVEITGIVNTAANLDQYFNIPFAKPPIGDLRFASPQPAEYGTTINATAYGPSCPQSPLSYASVYGDLAGPYGQSEDCLQLNVFVPRDVVYIATGLPVMVFVPGGGFFGGSAYSADGSIWLAAATAMNLPFVYVTVQHRLGVLGFPLENGLAKQGLTNLGLQDITLALEWVQRNINSFGGDPTKVTLGGQSAGAALTALTQLWPDKDLYRSTFLMSGSPSLLIQNGTGLIDTIAQPAWSTLLESVGCGNTSDIVTCLRTVNGTELLEIQTNISEATSPYALYGPTVDGTLVSQSPYQSLKEGKVRKVPFIIGNTKDEGTAFVPRVDLSDEMFRAYIAGQSLPPMGEETVSTLEDLYPDDPTLGSPFDTGNETFGLGSQYKRLAALATDRLYTAPRRFFASSITDVDVQGWSYRWDESGYPGVPAKLGAFHGADIFFLAGLPLIPGTNYTDAQKSLALSFITYVSNFIIFSDPNGAPIANVTSGGNTTLLALPYWPCYGSGDILLMESDNLTVASDDYRAEQITFMNTSPDVTRGF